MYLFPGITSLPEIPPNLLKKAYGMFIVLKTIRKIMRGTLSLNCCYFTNVLLHVFFAGKIAVSQYLDFRTVLSLMVRNKRTFSYLLK